MFEHPKQMLKMMSKNIFTILRSTVLYDLTYAFFSDLFNLTNERKEQTNKELTKERR